MDNFIRFTELAVHAAFSLYQYLTIQPDASHVFGHRRKHERALLTLLRNAQISFASRKRLRHQHTASRFASRSRRKAKRDTRWIVVQPLDDIEFSSDGEASSPEELSDAKPRSSTRLSELAKRKKKRLSSFHSADDAASSEFDTESELDESPVVPLIRPPLVASPPIEQEEEDDGDEEEDEGLPAQDTTQDNDKGAKDEKYRQLELELAALRAQMQAILAGTTPAINVPPSAPKVAAPPPPPPPPPPPRNTEIRVPLPLSRTKRALSTLNEGTVSSPCLILQPQNLDKGRLRRSEVQRSPGGTPVRVVDENSKAPQSTADFIASALKRKFQSVQSLAPNSPDSPSDKENNKCNPFQSEAGLSPLRPTRLFQ